MKLFAISAVMALIGMLASGAVITVASPDGYVVDEDTAVAMTEEELDAYISELIDQQFAEVLRQRLEGESGEVVSTATN